MSNPNAPSAEGASGVRVKRGAALLRAAVLLGAIGGVSTVAQADTAKTPDGSFTMYGITLSGALDVGFQYQSHGVPESDYFPPGTEALINKNSNGPQTNILGNSLSQSNFAITGREEFGDGWAGVFRLQMFINPTSGNISDALKSLTANNGTNPNNPYSNQNTGADASIAGQLFGGAAFAGLTHPQFGTLTFGRQNGLMADGVAKYDPLAASQAFSVIGWSGAAAGGGNTENRRLDHSIKYDLLVGPIHAGVQYQAKTASMPGSTQEYVLGFVFPGGSVDVIHAQKNDAVAASSLSAAQVTTLPLPFAPPGVAGGGGGGSAFDKSLVGTISDNTATGIMAKYSFNKQVTASAGYEHIAFTNPSRIVSAGTTIIGGYVLAYVNNSAFPSTKTLAISWAGVKIAATPHLDVTGAYYRYDQNSYAVGANAGCKSSVVSAQCSGTLNAASLVLDYKFTKRFDVYGGAMWSGVQGGLANGFLNSSTIDPTIGARYQF